MKVLVSAMGQRDNVGDTVLRRGYLDALRPLGDLTVFVGARDDDHVSGLGLQPGDEAVRDHAEWRRLLSKQLTTEGAVYAFDTGEIELQRAYALRYLRLAPLLATNRMQGGSALHVGVGVRAASAWKHPVATVLRQCSAVSWRDRISRDMVGLGEVTPDWAFATGSPSDELIAGADAPRDTLAIAVRTSLAHALRRDPDAEWARRVRTLADRQGLRPVTVAQIERDGPLAERLADALGTEAITWTTPNHAEQEARIREVYRRSALVMSDRLHGLVIGATEGAVPVALSTGRLDKAVRTLAAVGISNVDLDRALPDEQRAHERLSAAIGRRAEVASRVDAARERLGALASSFPGAPQAMLAVREEVA